MALSAVCRPAGFVVMLALTASCGRHASPRGDASTDAAFTDAPVETFGDTPVEQRGSDAGEDVPAPVAADGAVDQKKPAIDRPGFDGPLGDAANGLCVGEGWCWGNTSLQGNALAAVWGSGPKDVWAVGEAGTILHFDGSAWSPVASGTTSRLKSVWGVTANDVWAVGDGAFLHWNGKAWSNLDYQIPDATPGGPSPTLSVREVPATRVWGTAANDVWVVTGTDVLYPGSNLILHWDGSSWSARAVSSGGGFSGVWGSGPRDVWASAGGSWLSHWDGREWMSTRPDVAFIGAGPLWGTGPNDVWLAGGGGPDLIYHRDAKGWSEVKCAAPPCVRVTDVWGAAANDVWTVGKSGVTYHWNGTAWSAVDSGTSQDLAGVWGSGPSDVWSVGASGTIRHWDGVRWSGADGGSNGKVHVLTGIWGGGGHMWAVGGSAHDAYAVHWDGRAWSETLVVPGVVDPNLGATSNVLSSVWGSDPDDVWAVGSEAFNDSIQHWDGAKWSSFSTGTPIGLTGVWGSDRDDVWAVGAGAGGGKLLHWDGARWSKVTAGLGLLPKLTAVWGSGAMDVWIVGGAGQFLHFDGTHWTVSAQDDSVAFNGVWGSGPTDVWAVGLRAPNFMPKEGVILHWDGMRWSPAGPAGPLPALYAVSGSDADDVFAVGGDGSSNANVLHWSSQAWAPLASGTTKPLRGVWATRPFGAFMVGDFAGILHR